MVETNLKPIPDWIWYDNVLGHWRIELHWHDKPVVVLALRNDQTFDELLQNIHRGVY
jgi:hypothetical protein